MWIKVRLEVAPVPWWANPVSCLVSVRRLLGFFDSDFSLHCITHLQVFQVPTLGGLVFNLPGISNVAHFIMQNRNLSTRSDDLGKHQSTISLQNLECFSDGLA